MAFISAEFGFPIDMQQLHFLRPEWLWGLLLLLPLALWLLRASHSAGAWKQWVDPALQSLVLTQGKSQRQWYKQLWLALVWGLACVALAGPVWQQLPSPLLRSDQARIVVLDLSRSMLAKDLQPSRLELARLKVRDILQQSRDSKAGLVAFAAQAFPIAPLTDDIQTLLAQVPTLHPDLMPAQGGRVDRALLQAKDMLAQGGAAGGQVVLVTDSKPREATFAAAQLLRDAGYELSVLAVGTAQGAPIPEDTRRGRGFVKDRSGNIVIAKLPIAELRQLALSGGGKFSLLTADDSDIQKLSSVLEQDAESQDTGELGKEALGKTGDRWAEAGPLLLLLLLPLALLGFRRGWLMAALLFVSVPSVPEAYAEEAEVGSSLWFNADQRGHQALEQGDAEQAQNLFESPDWKAAAAYKAGSAEQAAEHWAQQDKAEAAYNLGNALAQKGDLQAALGAWQSVPEEHALAASAQHNAEVIQALLEQQKQEQDQQQEGDDDSESDESQEDQESSNEPEEGESQEGQSEDKSGEQQPSDEEAGQPEQNDSSEEQEPTEQQQADEQAAEDEAEQTKPEATEEKAAEEQTAAPQMSAAELAEEQAQDQVIEQWLNRVPDDPGGLLREKFKRDYQRRSQQRGNQYQDEEEAW